MLYEQITYESANLVATIALNRPDKLNAWTQKMEEEVVAAVRAAAADDQVRVIILTGAGKGFCAGADMSLLSSISQESAPRAGRFLMDNEMGSDVPAEFRKKHAWFLSVPKPIIAAINGPAVGLGFILPLYCDFRFASEKARFSAIFSKRGLVGEYGMAWMLPRLIGVPNAIELMFTAKMVDAGEALRIGLVSRVFPEENFLSAVQEFARELATTVSPRSVRIMKRQIYTGLLQNFDQAYEAALDEMRGSFGTEDFREGVAHFLEKRAAAFTGR
jgi:enoyl-CoA hydratase/carnithine racemase